MPGVTHSCAREALGGPQKLSSALGQSSGPEDSSGFLPLLPPPDRDLSGSPRQPKVVAVMSPLYRWGREVQWEEMTVRASG